MRFIEASSGKKYNIADYIKQYVSKNGKIKIFVGCDSQVKGGLSEYVIAVVLYRDGQGGKVLYKKNFYEVRNKSEESFIKERLFKEVEESLNVAEYLDSELKENFKWLSESERVCDIDLDINPDDGHGHNKSNLIMNAGKGWVAGSGYKVRLKPMAWAASCAADFVIRHGGKLRDTFLSVK